MVLTRVYIPKSYDIEPLGSKTCPWEMVPTLKVTEDIIIGFLMLKYLVWPPLQTAYSYTTNRPSLSRQQDLLQANTTSYLPQPTELRTPLPATQKGHHQTDRYSASLPDPGDYSGQQVR